MSSTSTYTAIASYDNGRSKAAAAVFSLSPTAFATISPDGALSAEGAGSDETITLFASYTEGSITKTASMDVVITVRGVLSLNRTFNGHAEMDGEESRVSGVSVSSWTVSRNNAGRIVGKTETIDGTTSVYEYAYDPQGRLLSVKKDGVLVEEYQYGPNGSRVFDRNTLRGIMDRTLTYSVEDHLLTAGDVVYQYDGDGFLMSKARGGRTTFFEYSSRVELLSVTFPDGKRIEYVYDPQGRRIAKKVDGAVAEKYLWEGMTRLLAVFDGDENLILRFQYADGRMPLAMTKSGANYYLSYDQVGSLKVVSDTFGNAVKQIDYDSYGNVLNDSNPAFGVPFSFAGGLYDPDTELVRFGYRDYDPTVGRWTAKDPIFFAGGNAYLYGYVLNDPVNFVDPWGLFNPAKVLSSLGNAANASRLYAGGTLKLAAAAGLTGTGVGAPVGAGTAALGTWNLWSAQSAWTRSMQQWNEAWNESWSDASWKNLLGVLPFGTEFDDLCEPSAGEVFKDKAKNFSEKPGEFLKEIGTWGF